jgi:hypothetical protein
MSDLQNRAKAIQSVKDMGAFLIKSADKIEVLSMSFTLVPEKVDSLSSYNHLTVGDDLMLLGLLNLSLDSLMNDMHDRRLGHDDSN